MKIKFNSSGGYANLRLSYQVDTDEIPSQLAQELLALVDSSGLFELEASDVAPA